MSRANVSGMAYIVEKGGLEALQQAPFLDFKVVCKDKSWKVHKLYLCGDSEALVKHCTEMREAQEGVVTFNEEEPRVVEQFLIHQYLGDYKDFKTPGSNFLSRPQTSLFGPNPINSSFGTQYPSPANPSWNYETQPSSLFPQLSLGTKEEITSALVLNVQMYSLADRFDLKSLMRLAVQRIMSREDQLRYCNLTTLLSKIQEVTAPDDIALRYRIFARCIANPESVKANPGAAQVLQSMSLFACKVADDKTAEFNRLWTQNTNDLNKYRQEHRTKINALSTELETSRLRTSELQNELEAEKSKHSTASQQLAKKKQKVNPLQKLNHARKQEINQLNNKLVQHQNTIKLLYDTIDKLRDMFNYGGPV